MEEQVLSPSSSNLSPFSSSLDDLFSAQNTEVDVGLEWLSVFVEDCFSSPGSCLLGPPDVDQGTTTTSKASTPLQRPNQKQSGLQNFAVPGKARSKRKRLSAPRSKETLSLWWQHLNPQKEDIGMGRGTEPPPLLKQAYWLADSELMVAKKEEEEEEEKRAVGRRCSHCEAQRTPQWRAGPMGPKTLCNACGVRYKSGRLLPEYRPAKSPTFVSNVHSNSHKKVMQMRTSLLSSTPSPTHHHH